MSAELTSHYLPRVIITHLVIDTLLEEVKLSATDGSVAVQVNSVVDLSQGSPGGNRNTNLKRRQVLDFGERAPLENM